jgi:hypothetical protein
MRKARRLGSTFASGFAVFAALAALAALAPRAALAAEKAGSSQASTPSASRAALARARVPQFPADVRALGTRLESTSSPAVKAWAAQNAPGVAKGPGDPETLSRSSAQARWPHLRPGGYDALAFLLVFEGAERLQAQVKKDLDSLSEMGEMESLRLQMAMDRLSKMMSTLSNLLKKISDTDASIVQNLK